MYAKKNGGENWGEVLGGSVFVWSVLFESEEVYLWLKLPCSSDKSKSSLTLEHAISTWDVWQGLISLSDLFPFSSLSGLSCH